MIDKIKNNQVSDLLAAAYAKQSAAAKAPSGQHADASLQISYESFVQTARELPVEDSTAVDRARQLLLSGELDSPENIRKAAENILEYGI